MKIDDLVEVMVVSVDNFGRAEILDIGTGCILWQGNLSFRPDRGEEIWVNLEAWIVESTSLNFYSVKKGELVDRSLLRIFVSEQR